MHAIIGQECHIVARSAEGPRGNADDRDGVDEYPNLILLCANCHVIVDSQPERFTTDALTALKAQHEASVSASKAAGPPRIELSGRDAPVRLSLMADGDRLMSLLAPSLSFRHDAPADLTTPERAAIGSFMQDCADWSDIVNDIGPKGFYDAAESVQAHIESLGEIGLLVLAGTQRLTLRGGEGAPTDWPEVVIKVIRAPERDGGADGSPNESQGPI